MALLLVVAGGVLAAGAAGCGVDHANPFRPIGADAAVDLPMDVAVDAAVDLGGTGGSGVDGGVDTAPLACPTNQVGYSTMTGTGGTTGTTGGGAGPTVMVSTLAQLQAQAAVVGPLTIAIHGTIDLSSLMVKQIEITSDKTVVGAEPGAGLINGGLLIIKQHNVIVHNLTIAKAPAPSDAVGIQASDHVWVDHCDFSTDLTAPRGTYDGLVDVTHASDYVTVSWTRFHDHYNVSLVGHSANNAAEDSGHLTVTFHHNQFLRTPTGSPRARFGHVHVFGNHYQTVDTYAVGSESNATVLVEGNVFDQVTVPIETNVEDNVDGFALDLNNLYNPMSSQGANAITTTWNNWKPPYDYTADSKFSVTFLVDTCAGVGKVP